MEEMLEYLGWLSGTASALNNSKNPVKAAHTILAGEKQEKMVEKFMNRKKESVAPKDAADYDQVSRMFNKFEKWVEQTEAEGRAHKVSQQDLADAEGDMLP